MTNVRDELKLSVPRLSLAYSSDNRYRSAYYHSAPPKSKWEIMEDNLILHYCTYFRTHCWRRYVSKSLLAGNGPSAGGFVIEDNVPDMGEIELAIYNLVLKGLDLKMVRPLPITRPIIKLWQCRLGSIFVTAQMTLSVISTSLAHISGDITPKYDGVIATTSNVFPNSTNKMGSSPLYNNQRNITCVKGIYTIDVVDYLNSERKVMRYPEIITLNQVNLSCTRLIFKLNHIGGIVMCTVSRRSLQITERCYIEMKGPATPMYFTNSSLKFTANSNILHKSVVKLDIYGSVCFTGDPTLVGDCFSNMYESIAAVVKDTESFRLFIGSLRVIQEIRNDALASNNSQ